MKFMLGFIVEIWGKYELIMNWTNQVRLGYVGC
jgi:hypothetical protein